MRISSGPCASFSKVRRSMLVIRLPKRSTRRTWPSMLSPSTSGRGISRRWIASGGPAEGGDVDALGEPRRGRREAIPPFERAAHCRPRVLPLGQLDDPLGRMLVEDGRQHAVVGRDERVVAGVGGDAAARRADAWIDDDEENRAGGKIAIGRGELERAAEHIVRGDVVRDVDQRHVRTDPERDAFHRACVVIARAEVGEHGDDRASHALSLSEADTWWNERRLLQASQRMTFARRAGAPY